MKVPYTPLCMAVAAMFSSHAQADHSIKLPAIDVVDKAIKEPLTQPGIEVATEQINKTAGGVGIVDMEQVREGRVSTFNDTLGLAAGVFVQSRFGAEESRLSIRGSGLQRTFHGRGIKLMQDGIPVNLADGSFDFQAIEPMATRYIEVYRGANALRYGASNLGGAINFVSPTGHTAPALETRVEFGSFGYRRFGVATGGVIGDLDYFVSASTFDQDGFRDFSEQQAQRINANIGYRINEDIETRFYLGYSKSDSNLPGNLTKAQLRNDPSDAFLSPATLQQKRDLEVTRIANKTTLRWDNAQLDIGAYYSDKNLFHPIFQVLDQDNHDAGLDVRYTRTGSLFGHKNEVVVGFNPSYGVTNDDRFVNIQGNRGARTNQSRQTAKNLEMYAENRFYVTPELALVAGLQYTNAKRKLEDQFFANAAQDESFNVRYVQTNPKLGVLYQASPHVQWYANVSRSYEPPSFGELAGGLTPNIVSAQEGTTLEIGTRGQSTHVDWDVSVYHAKLRNELLQTAVFVAGNNPLPVAQTTNAGNTTHAGLEMGLTVRLPWQLQWRHSLLLNEFYFDGENSFGNSRLPGIPRALLRGELLYRQGGFYIGPTIESSPQRYAVDFAETLYADSYTLFGLKVGQQINKHWSWFLEGRNLGNEKYAATTSVIRNSNGMDGPLFLPGDGRSAYLGVQWRY
ncbi:TonB-dependent receptor family protein [Methylobacillus flagellatus]|uniref:TonB-dependent receptor family protein n=1 Tax=Methylobacillus flagellatus TaxID=405 RepID=UPI0010F68A06|nr:TonB-dependent receptor [Methylobacillus flagellatus]